MIAMQLFERYVSPHALMVFTFEVLLICGSLSAAILLQEPDVPPGLAWKVLIAATLCLLCLYYNDFYDLNLVRSGRELVVRLVQAAGVTTILLAILYLAVPAVALHADAFLRSLAVIVPTVLAWRLVFNHLVPDSPFVENTLVLGTGPAARAVARELVTHHDLAARVVGYVDDDLDAIAGPGPVPIVGGTRDIPALVAQGGIRRIVVGPAGRHGRLPVQALVDAKLSGVVVEDARAAYERLTGKMLIEALTLRQLVFADGFRASRRRRAIKRACDVTLSGIGIVLASPLIALTAVMVWAVSGRPVLYRQERVGQYGTVFTLYKFRSMKLDAEADGPAWAAEDDDRVTRIGRVIRLTRLDELPQLWNVLVGHMSFVGPRPERPCFVEQLAAESPFYQLRHTVKPGITGWAQVKYGYAGSVESAMEKLRYDLYYVKHLSTPFDMTIVIDTVKTILFRVGSR